MDNVPEFYHQSPTANDARSYGVMTGATTLVHRWRASVNFRTLSNFVKIRLGSSVPAVAEKMLPGEGDGDLRHYLNLTDAHSHRYWH